MSRCRTPARMPATADASTHEARKSALDHTAGCWQPGHTPAAASPPHRGEKRRCCPTHAAPFAAALADRLRWTSAQSSSALKRQSPERERASAVRSSRTLASRVGSCPSSTASYSARAQSLMLLSCSIAPVATSSFSGWQSSARTASERWARKQTRVGSYSSIGGFGASL